MIYERSQELFYYCGFLSSLATRIEIDYSPLGNEINITLKEDLSEVREKLNLDRKTFNSAYAKIPSKITTEGFVVLMPFEAWEKVFASIKNLPTRQKKTIVRVFLYLYYNSMRFSGRYTHSRESIIKEIKINKDSFSNAVDFLEDNGLCGRTSYSVLDANRLARTYFIPPEM